MQKDKKYHFIGIGGIGMSALASILLEKQLAVSGSDMSLNDSTDQLRAQGATIFKGHAAAHVDKEATIIFNTQISADNPEFLAAKQLQCPILHRSDLLADLLNEKFSLLVTGTHGKTTTSSLLAWMLLQGGEDPTFILGGKVRGVNGRSGQGKFLVAEADESDGSFLKYFPEGAILTNIEKEHLDHYETESQLQAAFSTFMEQVKQPELLFYCSDDFPLATSRGISYGFQGSPDLKVENYQQRGWCCSFDLHFRGRAIKEITLSLIGRHNALNAAAVFGLSLQLGVKEACIRQAFLTFPGVGRRCEKKRDNELLFIDDYGHHPTEIATTLDAIKTAVQERRLIAIFQPHRFSRTRDLWEQFQSCFERADELILTDIYSAFEEPIAEVNAQKLADAIRKKATVPCRYLPKSELAGAIKEMARPHDVIVTFGAGDITHLHKECADFSPKKLKVGLLFGGRSCEHEISLRSARFVSSVLSSQLYEITYFGIDRKGRWVAGEEAKKLLQEQTTLHSNQAVDFLHPDLMGALSACDLFFPILHGTNGEDGTLQGFFEFLAKPYVGPNLTAAAICMNKVLTKRLVETAGVKTPPDLNFSYHQWLTNKEALLHQIAATLTFPVFVKPIHLGSSVGIAQVNQKEQLEEAISAAFRHDSHVMVEEGRLNCRELEFAVLGNSQGFRVEAPPPGEKLSGGSFVDYEKKYGAQAISSTVAPHLSQELIQKGQILAKRAYEAVGCTGLTRVDFLLDAEGEYWLFEMNSIPGMQQLSLFPKIWAREGLGGEKLMDRLILLALERGRQQQRHLYASL